jgi:hypothetical protein
MTKAIASSILGIGGIMIGTGFLMQRRALAQYGKKPRPRVLGYWNCAELFDDKRGMKLYLKGDALFSWGMMLYFAMIGYFYGRD